MGNGACTKEELSLLRYKYDKDQNGKINFTEAKEMAEEIRKREGVPAPLPHDKLLSIFQKLDDDGSGTLTFDEFEDAFELLREQRVASKGKQGKGKGKTGKTGKTGQPGAVPDDEESENDAPATTGKGQGKINTKGFKKGPADPDYDPNANPFENDTAFKAAKKKKDDKKKKEKLSAEQEATWGGWLYTTMFGEVVEPEKKEKKEKKGKKDGKEAKDEDEDAGWGLSALLGVTNAEAAADEDAPAQDAAKGKKGYGKKGFAGKGMAPKGKGKGIAPKGKGKMGPKAGW